MPPCTPPGPQAGQNDPQGVFCPPDRPTPVPGQENAPQAVSAPSAGHPVPRPRPQPRWTCHCSLYAFPHRAGGGRCSVPPRDQADYLCSACGERCTPAVVDNGIGAYEFWGQRGFHSEVGVVSDCCEEALVYNDSFRTPVDSSVLHEIERGDRDDH